MEIKRRKIALIIGQLSHGGAERQLYLLSKGLKQTQEFEPVIFCLTGYANPYGERLTSAGINWHAYSGRNYKLSKISWLISTIKKENISLLYGFLHIGNIYAGLTALVVGLTYITSIRNANINLSLKLKILSGISCRFANTVIANSSSCVQALRRDLKVTHGRVVIISNAVEIEPVKPHGINSLRMELKIPNQTILVGTVALLKKQKRPLYFIDVFLELSKIYQREFHFVWVGDGPMRSEVDKMLGKLPKEHLERLHFIGYRTEIRSCLSFFDVFILTSAYEGMPNALLESMAAGLPCVATEVEGTRDIFEMAPQGKEVGLLADPDDPDKFALVLQGLLENPTRMKQMGQNAKEYVEKVFGLQRMVKRHLKVFQNSLIR